MIKFIKAFFVNLVGVLCSFIIVGGFVYGTYLLLSIIDNLSQDVQPFAFVAVITIIATLLITALEFYD